MDSFNYRYAPKVLYFSLVAKRNMQVRSFTGDFCCTLHNNEKVNTVIITKILLCMILVFCLRNLFLLIDYIIHLYFLLVFWYFILKFVFNLPRMDSVYIIGQQMHGHSLTLSSFTDQHHINVLMSSRTRFLFCSSSEAAWLFLALYFSVCILESFFSETFLGIGLGISLNPQINLRSINDFYNFSVEILNTFFLGIPRYYIFSGRYYICGMCNIKIWYFFKYIF